MPLKNLNNFVKIEDLSRGAQGEVILVQHKENKKKYALKTYLGRLDPAAFKEIEILQSVEHPNIVQFYDYYINKKGTCSLLLEYIKGQSLNKYIADHTELSLIQQLYAVRDTALGLATLHDHKLIHCDVKPQNILVSRQQNNVITRLADFGVAITSSSENNSIKQNFVGTALYMPPESFIQGGAVREPTTDIYALGMVLYEVLAKRLPFDKKINDKFFAHIQSSSPFPSVSNYASFIPDTLTHITMKCLEKDRKKRYQHVQEFLHDYENCITTYQSELTFPDYIKQPILGTKPLFTKENSYTIMKVALGVLLAGTFLSSTLENSLKPSTPPTSRI